MSDPNLDDTLAEIVKQSPSRVLEAYYWSQEEGLLEFIRGFLRMPIEAQAVLKALIQNGCDPSHVQVLVDHRAGLDETERGTRSTLVSRYRGAPPTVQAL